MSLSNELIMRFVRATKDPTNNKPETTLYGTLEESGSRKYVRLDGSELLTPVESTSDARDGDRVTVMIKNHTATVTGNLSSPSARTAEVEGKLDILEAVRKYATIENLNATNVNVSGKLSAKDAELMYATVGQLNATNANVDGKLSAKEAELTYATIQKLEALEAEVDKLDVGSLTAEEADLRYANIDFTNIGKAAMQYFYAQSGLIKDVVVGNQTITGELVGVTISGDRLVGNTVVAEKLVIKGSDGLYYKLNTDGMKVEAEQTDQNSLNGQIIKAKSITATKISVDDLVAFDATIGGFNITENSLYSGVKSSVDNTTNGVYLDKDGQMAIGDASHYLKYYKDADGSYKLDISAKSISASSGSGIDLESALSNIHGINLFTGSADFSGDWYMSHTWTADGTDKNGNTVMKRSNPWEGITQFIDAKKGETLVMSANVRGDGNATMIFYVNELVDIPDYYSNPVYQVGDFGIVAPTVETRISSLPYVVKSDCRLRFRIESSVENATLWVSSLKLERGVKATDWSPAPGDSAKTATNFLHYDSTGGLQVGNKMSGVWNGFRTQITNAAFNILNSAGTTLASYGEKLIELGKNATDAVIKLCGGKGQIEYTADADTGENYLQMSSDRLRLKSSIMSSLYSMYTNNSNRWEKSAANVSPTAVRMYASNCTDPTMVEKVEGWSTSTLDIYPNSIDVYSPGDVKVRSGGSLTIYDNYGSVYSVQNGSSGIWTYKKWSNGDVELWGTFSVSNLNCNTALGNMYRTAAFTPNSFPFTVYNPNLVASYESTGYGAFLWATTLTTNTAPPNYYLVRPTSTTITSGKINFHVRGKWKT